MRAALRGPSAAGRSDDTPFVAALHVGPVVYGNIGSLDRLDFTVVGPTVNYVSRLEGIAKLLDRRAVCSADVAPMLPAGMVKDLGRHPLKGFAETQAVFELTAIRAPRSSQLKTGSDYLHLARYCSVSPSMRSSSACFLVRQLGRDLSPGSAGDHDEKPADHQQ